MTTKTKNNDLEHAYSMLRGVTNKPGFAELYRQISIFLEPFRDKQSNLVWIPDQSSWTPIKGELKDDKESTSADSPELTVDKDEIEEER